MLYYYAKITKKISIKVNQAPFKLSKTMWYFAAHIVFIIGLDLIASPYVTNLAFIFQSTSNKYEGESGKITLCKDLFLSILYLIIIATILKKYLVNQIIFYINKTFIKNIEYFDVGHIDFHGSNQIIDYKDKISKASIDIIYNLIFTIAYTIIGTISMVYKKEISIDDEKILYAGFFLFIALFIGYLVQLAIKTIINRLYTTDKTYYYKSIAQLVKLYTFYNFYGVHKQQINKILNTTNNNYSKSTKHDLFSKLSDQIYQFIFALYSVLLIYYFNFTIRDIGRLFAACITIVQLLSGLIKMYFSYYTLQDANKFFEKLRKKTKNKKQEKITNIKKIELKNIGYKVDDLTVLNNISGSIDSTDIIGLVGPSGCGKSTLLKILIGLKNSTSGSVYVNNKPINNFNINSLMTKFTYISQNDNILSGETLKYNITLGQNFSDSDIYNVLNQVGLLEWSKGLPKKLDTVIGENASNMSGGQRKKIQIARALLSSIHNSSIIILDEPTVGIDHISAIQCIDIIMSIAKKNKQIVIITSHNIKLINKIVNKYIFCDSNKQWTFGTYKDLHQKSQDFRNYFANIKNKSS